MNPMPISSALTSAALELAQAGVHLDEVVLPARVFDALVHELGRLAHRPSEDHGRHTVVMMGPLGQTTYRKGTR